MAYHRLKILLIPLITILMMFSSVMLMVFFDYRTFTEVKDLALNRILYTMSNSILTVAVFFFVVRWLNRVFSWSVRGMLRLLVDIGLILGYSFALLAIMRFLMTKGILSGHPLNDIREFVFIVPLMMNSLFLVVIEMVLAVEERNRLEVQVAKLEKEQISTKYGALKEQLDHHFLFNNLSVLSSLMYEDVEKADCFIHNFASVYRYVLQINQRNIVKLEEELAFINTYLDLYKFRFEEGFKYRLKVDDEHCCYLIPPLTLQGLVENAIKHNMVSKQYPLSLEVYNEGDRLFVKNNLQLKNERTVSTKTGQINLVEKYRLLGDGLPVFRVEGGEYVVEVPLIEPGEANL